MRWAAAEAAAGQARELETLRAEAARAARSREEALESQRRDLTDTFEGLIMFHCIDCLIASALSNNVTFN